MRPTMATFKTDALSLSDWAGRGGARTSMATTPSSAMGRHACIQRDRSTLEYASAKPPLGENNSPVAVRSPARPDGPNDGGDMSHGTIFADALGSGGQV